MDLGFFYEVWRKFVFDFSFIYVNGVMEDVFVKFCNNVLFIIVDFVSKDKLFFSNEVVVEYLVM